MKFTKMHGLGNDYVYVDCFSEQPLHGRGSARAVHGGSATATLASAATG
jgi:diaminopimelate epimerase